jgi:hypothetical protein
MAAPNSFRTPTAWEKKSYDYFLSVMDKQQPIRHCFMDARMSLESIILNLYREKTKQEPVDLLSSIDALKSLNQLPNDGIYHTMHFIRKIGNGQVHPGDEYNVELLNTIRLGLLSILKWHFLQTRNYGNYKKDFEDYSRKTASIKENPLLYMFRNEGFSETVIGQKLSGKKKEPRGVKLLSARKPIFAIFIIDMSGSMAEFKDDTIAAHSEAIEALRGSAICINKSLYLTQYVFNDSIHPPINQLEPLLNEGNDNIILLNSKNYNPAGTTALYDTIDEALANIYEEIAAIRKNDSRKAEVSIAVITDGADNTSKMANASQIKQWMENLIENKFHHSSVVIGLTDSKTFSKEKLEEIRKAMGFSESIAIDFAEPDVQKRRKKIREAFLLGSQKLAGK